MDVDFVVCCQVPSVSVSMVETRGKSFVNPGYEAGEQSAAATPATAITVSAGVKKVNKKIKYILRTCPSAWWLHVSDRLHANSFRSHAKGQTSKKLLFPHFVFVPLYNV